MVLSTVPVQQVAGCLDPLFIMSDQWWTVDTLQLRLSRGFQHPYKLNPQI